MTCVNLAFEDLQKKFKCIETNVNELKSKLAEMENNAKKKETHVKTMKVREASSQTTVETTEARENVNVRQPSSPPIATFSSTRLCPSLYSCSTSKYPVPEWKISSEATRKES